VKAIHCFFASGGDEAPLLTGTPEAARKARASSKMSACKTKPTEHSFSVVVGPLVLWNDPKEPGKKNSIPTRTTTMGTSLDALALMDIESLQCATVCPFLNKENR
jgi:hypothetical protein